MRRRPGGGWTAPLFLAQLGGSVGATVGVEKVASVVLCLNGRLAEKLSAGEARAALGADLSIQLGPVLGSVSPAAATACRCTCVCQGSQPARQPAPPRGPPHAAPVPPSSPHLHPLTNHWQEIDAYELPSDDVDLVCFSTRGHGLILDASIKGGSLAVDGAKLAAAYGAGTTAKAVLAGSVPAPPEYAALYARLDALEAQ